MMRFEYVYQVRHDVRHNRRGRHAMSLVEVMVVVTLSALLLGTILSFVVTLQRSDAKFRDHGVRCDQTARLAEVIRGDIRAATDVSLTSKDSLRIVGDNQQTRYEVVPKGCQQIITNGDGSERRELFVVGSAGFWKIESDKTQRRPLVTLSLEAPIANEPERSTTQLLVCAALGANRADSDARPADKRDANVPEAKP